MEALMQDVKYSFRQFRRVPLFVAGVINRWRPRRALVVLEIAAAVVLTLGGALLAKSFGRFQAVDRGFHAANVLEASITLSTVRHPDAASRRAFFDALVERLRQVSSVETVSISKRVSTDFR